jgi:hypothetical protein
MPSNAESIRDLYNTGLSKVNEVVRTGAESEVDVALQTLDDLTAMMLAFEISSVRGRTALLSGLIVELTQVVEGIKEDSPASGALTDLAALIDKARERLVEEKKALLQTD